MNFIETEIEKRPYTSFMFQKEKESSAGVLGVKKVFCKIWKPSGKKFQPEFLFCIFFKSIFKFHGIFHLDIWRFSAIDMIFVAH